jgi:uncharacterized protein YkwD
VRRSVAAVADRGYRTPDEFAVVKISARLCATLIGAALASCSLAPSEVAVDARTERAIAAVKLDPQAVLEAINAYRAGKGLGALRLDASLTAMAQQQADAMAASGQLSHNVAGAFAVRLAADHIDAAEAGENLGAGYYSLAGAMAGWKGSPEHNANLLRPGFTRLSVAIAKNPRTSWGVYWATEFAGEPKPKDVGLLTTSE